MDRRRPAWDVYAMGLVLLELLTGSKAFPGTAIESLVARTLRSPDIPASLGPGWCALLQCGDRNGCNERPTAAEAAAMAGRLVRAVPAASMMARAGSWPCSRPAGSGSWFRAPPRSSPWGPPAVGSARARPPTGLPSQWISFQPASGSPSSGNDAGVGQDVPGGESASARRRAGPAQVRIAAPWLTTAARRVSVAGGRVRQSGRWRRRTVQRIRGRPDRRASGGPGRLRPTQTPCPCTACAIRGR